MVIAVYSAAKLAQMNGQPMPESFTAHEFSKAVDRFAAEPSNPDVLDELANFLNPWSNIYSRIKDHMMEEPRLSEVEFLAIGLSDLSKIARLVMRM